MDRSHVSIAQQVRDYVARLPRRAFVHVRDIPGSRRAVESEMSRLAKRGDVSRVSRGLYWKSPKTSLGMARPRPEEVARELVGAAGGPSGISAARHFGLTTQVPSLIEYAVPGRAPTAKVPGVRFVSRSYERRLHALNETEVALVEVLRDFPVVAEGSLKELAAVVRKAIEDERVRPMAIREVIDDERHVKARERWQTLEERLAAVS